jgi:urease accessory protein
MKSLGLLLLTSLLSPLALAHSGHGEHASFYSGWLHSLTGWDHLLAMLAVGLLAGQSQSRLSALQLPGIFLLGLALGGALGFTQIIALPAETGVWASLVFFGLALLWRSAPLRITAALTALFALCHGAAHGGEIPASQSALSFILGALTASASAHLLGAYLSRQLPALGIRLLGACCALGGAALALGAA